MEPTESAAADVQDEKDDNVNDQEDSDRRRETAKSEPTSNSSGAENSEEIIDWRERCRRRAAKGGGKARKGKCKWQKQRPKTSKGNLIAAWTGAKPECEDPFSAGPELTQAKVEAEEEHQMAHG